MSGKELTMKNIVMDLSYFYSENTQALYSIQQGLDFVYSFKIERKHQLCGNRINDIMYLT